MRVMSFNLGGNIWTLTTNNAKPVTITEFSEMKVIIYQKFAHMSLNLIMMKKDLLLMRHHVKEIRQREEIE